MHTVEKEYMKTWQTEMQASKMGVTWPQAKQRSQPPEAGRGKDWLPLRASRESTAL